MKLIKLASKGYTMVDDADFEWLNKFHWYLSSNGYVYKESYINGKRKGERMARVILNAPIEMFTDHINGNRLDNRRENLRLITHAGNNKNVMGRGIHWDKKNKKWFAQISVDNKVINLGRYADEKEAERVYREAKLKYHGEFVRARLESAR